MTLLKVIFSMILLLIVGTNIWAALQQPFWEISLAGQPWFAATVVDAYLAFFTYWLWAAWLTRSLAMKIIWLLLIFGLGNMAMAAFALIRLWRLPKSATVVDFLTSREFGTR